MESNAKPTIVRLVNQIRYNGYDLFVTHGDGRTRNERTNKDTHAKFMKSPTYPIVIVIKH